MSTEITTAAELADYPPGSTFTARSGEVWMLERVHTMGSTDDLCAHLASPETPHASSTDVLRKWGPLTPQWRPDRPAQPTVQPSVEAIAQTILDCMPRMTISRELAESVATKVAETIGGRTEAEVLRQASADLLSEMSHFPLRGRHTRASWAAGRLLTYADRQEARHG